MDKEIQELLARMLFHHEQMIIPTAEEMPIERWEDLPEQTDEFLDKGDFRAIVDIIMHNNPEMAEKLGRLQLRSTKIITEI